MTTKNFPLDSLRKQLLTDRELSQSPPRSNKFPSLSNRSLSQQLIDPLSRDISHRHDPSLRQKSSFEAHEQLLQEILGIKQENIKLPTSLNELSIWVKKSNFEDTKEKLVQDLEKMKLQILGKKEKFLGSVMKEGGLLYRTQSGLVQPQICRLYDQEGINLYRKGDIVMKNAKNGESQKSNAELGAPSGRKEVEILIMWLEMMIQNHIEEVKDLTLEEKVRRAQLIYTACYKEVIRQVSVNCVERGVLMQRIWNASVDLQYLREDGRVKQLEELRERVDGLIKNALAEIKEKLAKSEGLCKELKEIIKGKDFEIDGLKNTLEQMKKAADSEKNYLDMGFHRKINKPSNFLQKKKKNEKNSIPERQLMKQLSIGRIYPKRPIILFGYYDTDDVFHKQKIIQKSDFGVNVCQYFEEVVQMVEFHSIGTSTTSIPEEFVKKSSEQLEKSSEKTEIVENPKIGVHKSFQFPERRKIFTVVKFESIKILGIKPEVYKKDKLRVELSEKEAKTPKHKLKQEVKDTKNNLLDFTDSDQSGEFSAGSIENIKEETRNHAIIEVNSEKPIKNKYKSFKKTGQVIGSLSKLPNLKKVSKRTLSNEIEPSAPISIEKSRSTIKSAVRSKKTSKNERISRVEKNTAIPTPSVAQTLILNPSSERKANSSNLLATTLSETSDLPKSIKPKEKQLKSQRKNARTPVTDQNPLKIRASSNFIAEETKSEALNNIKQSMIAKFLSQRAEDFTENSSKELKIDQGLEFGLISARPLEKITLEKPRLLITPLEDIREQTEFSPSDIPIQSEDQQHSPVTFTSKTQETLLRPLSLYDKSCQVAIDPIPTEPLSRAQIVSSIQELKTALNSILHNEQKRSDLLKDSRAHKRAEKLSRVLDSLFTINEEPYFRAPTLDKSCQTGNLDSNALETQINSEDAPRSRKLSDDSSERENSSRRSQRRMSFSSKLFQRSKSNVQIEEFKFAQSLRKVIIIHPGQKLLSLVLQSIENFDNVQATMSIKSLIKTINSVHCEKLNLCRDNPNYKKYEVSMILYDFLMNMYGLKTVAENKFKQVIVSTIGYKKTNTRVNNFSKFLGIDSDYVAEDWNFYLSAIESTEYNGSGFSGGNEINTFTSLQRLSFCARSIFENKLSEDSIEDIIRNAYGMRESEENALGRRKSIKIEDAVNTDKFLELVLQNFYFIKNRVYERLRIEVAREDFVNELQFNEIVKRNRDTYMKGAALDLDALAKVFEVHSIPKKDEEDKITKFIRVESFLSVLVDYSLVDFKSIFII